jgi:hypothetical protein
MALGEPLAHSALDFLGLLVEPPCGFKLEGLLPVLEFTLALEEGKFGRARFGKLLILLGLAPNP